MRRNMVENQIAARGITDQKVVNAIMSVPRHKFVPEELRSKAYNDTPLPIGLEQTISQPFMVAFMTRALELKPGDKALEIGTGSGYQAAILAEICDSVFTIEIFEALANRARATLYSLGYDNVRVRHADGYEGWAENAPYDAIIVTCSPHDIPAPLKEQLAEGGRMVIPVDEGNIQYLYILDKIDGEIEIQRSLPVRFVPMIKEDGSDY
jgi:protein-L-isoaspartate(D-aspartate) O-methyltransferase